MINCWYGVGNVGSTPEVKFLGSGQATCSFSIACNERWTDKQGQKQERTTWVPIVCWGKLAEVCGQYLTKGKQAFVSGRLQVREYEAKDGQKRKAYEIVADTVKFLGGGDRQQQAQPAEEEMPF